MSTAAVSFSDNAQNQAASAEQVTATVEEVSAGVENVEANTLEQFKRLGEFIKQMQKLSESINEMGDKLKETVNLSSDIAATAKFSENSLNDMTASMSRISESSSEMTGIVDIINDISEKINLLSLNAAIEAARAGDAGRGFAVVADEISKLADQTASSIKEIDKFIRSNNEEISRGMGNVESAIDTISTIISGVNRIGEMTNLLGEFMKKQLDTNALVNRDALEMRSRSEEMKGATEEQKTAVSEIVKSVSNINELTQANASGAEEMAGTSESLASMAENLKRTVDYFKF
jgi:methyl-accepting chemotaxis protein